MPNVPDPIPSEPMRAELMLAEPMIVFDLDGTLVDSAPDLVDSLNVILERQGIPPFPLVQARKFVGRGGRAMIRQGLDAAGAIASDAELEAMFTAYLAHYEEHLSVKTRYYPGVEAALDALAAAGHRLAILTNKYEKPARALIRDLGGTRRFATIVGQDTFPVCKPDAAALRLTIEKAGGDPARAIMVGDTETDVATARNAGLPVIAVDFGYAPDPVERLLPDRVISHFDQLADAVAALKAKLPVKVA